MRVGSNQEATRHCVVKRDATRRLTARCADVQGALDDTLAIIQQLLAARVTGRPLRMPPHPPDGRCLGRRPGQARRWRFSNREVGKILAAVRASGYEPHPGIDDITCHEGGDIPFWAPEGGGPPQ